MYKITRTLDFRNSAVLFSLPWTKNITTTKQVESYPALFKILSYFQDRKVVACFACFWKTGNINFGPVHANAFPERRGFRSHSKRIDWFASTLPFCCVSTVHNNMIFTAFSFWSTIKTVFKSMRFPWKSSVYYWGRKVLTHRNAYVCLFKRKIFDDLKTCIRAGQVAGTFLKRVLITILVDFLVMTPGW